MGWYEDSLFGPIAADIAATAPAGAAVLEAGCGSGALSVRLAFYNAARTDPATHPDTGRIQDEERKLALARIQTTREVPVQFAFVSSGTPFAFLSVDDFTPVSAEEFAIVRGTGFSVELSNLRLTAVELKKST